MNGDRIRELLGSARHARLFGGVRQRWERDGVGGVRTVTLRGLTEAERKALADLHGWDRVPRGDVVKVSLRRLDDTLLERGLGTLLEVVEALGGPVADGQAARAAALASETEMWAVAERHDAVAGNAALADWLAELRAKGSLTRASRSTGVARSDLLRTLLNAVGQLPTGGVPLSVFATRVTGDAHAFDAGTALGSLLLKAIARLVNVERVPNAARGRRQLWAAVGVFCDPLSATVLVFGLRAEGSDRLSRHLHESAEDGEPSVVTLRELVNARLTVPPGERVYVCENPGVVAAVADELGAESAVLVCIGGVPSTAGIELLSQLSEAEGDVRFHADFDWGGLRIGNQLVREIGARPWRFSTADYRDALGRATVPLDDRGPPAEWDCELAMAMHSAGRAVYEEALVDMLIDDLRWTGT